MPVTSFQSLLRIIRMASFLVAALVMLLAPLLLAPAAIAEDPCSVIDWENYGDLDIASGPTDRPAEQHPDLNLALRGFDPQLAAQKQLVFYNGDTDDRAPQLFGLFGDDRTPRIVDLYRVFDWDWNGNCRGSVLKDPEVTLLAVETRPAEVLFVPPAHYSIGSGYDVLVLYASELRLTMKFTRDDNVISGYTLHLENMCTEPRLLGLYRRLNAAGRGRLPALKAGQAIGRARATELGIAIRDNGVFMDPRSNKDWWKGR